MAANNFDSTNPFTDDVHNAIRISMIIIDVAGDILRNKLEEIICNKNNTFIYKRYDKKSYKDVQEYFEKNEYIYKYNSSFFEDQINAMYPNNNPAANVKNGKFDVTLCSRILLNIVLRPKTDCDGKPDDKDTSFGANIVRIKFIRDVNWAHVHKLGIKDSETKRLSEHKNKNDYQRLSLLAKLEYAINSLCKDSNESKDYEKKIDKCCECEIDGKKISYYKNKIANLVAKDLETHELIIKKLGEIGKNDENIIKLISEDKKLNKKNFDILKNFQQKLVKLLDHRFHEILTRHEFKENID